MSERIALAAMLLLAPACLCGPWWESDDYLDEPIVVPPQPDVAPVHAYDLMWMTGTWRAYEGARMQEELWTAPLGGTLFGIGRTTSDGRTRFFEHLRIEERPDGLVYVASPLGRGETEFKLTGGGTRRARFENPAHDWPTSIEYALRDDGSMTATVSGPGRTEEYVWVRHGV